ncbi:hypothetical protein Golob_019340, partial [Gossypium lobatum]|nr:hypothetical protein [Gossypium lobatum]
MNIINFIEYYEKLIHAFICCLAVANINATATNPAIRRDLCRCFKKAGHGAGVVSDKAKQLLRLYDVRVTVPIDPTVNCG